MGRIRETHRPVDEQPEMTLRISVAPWHCPVGTAPSCPPRFASTRPQLLWSLDVGGRGQVRKQSQQDEASVMQLAQCRTGQG